MISDTARHEILRRLTAIEAEDDVRILLAVESGSRAWGFPSANSDYDARFIYVRRPQWYWSIDLEHRRDVIERPIVDDYDVSGWDLRKALQLFRKSNPPLLEWLRSPIIYREHAPAADAFRALVPAYFSPLGAAWHYLSMARSNYKDYLQRNRVRTKKYFYVLRPLLAVLWIEAGKGPVPMRFDTLVDAIVEDAQLQATIAKLVAQKRAGAELDDGPRIPALNLFIERELARLADGPLVSPPPKPPVEPLNTYFRTTVAQLWA